MTLSGAGLPGDCFGLCPADSADLPGGTVLNVATGHSITILDLYRRLCDLIGVEPAPRFGAAREGDVRHSRADIGKIRALLGYDPRVSLKDGLRQTLDWYRAARPVPGGRS